MRTLLDDLAVIDNNQPIGVSKRSQPVSDSNSRSSLDQIGNRLLDPVFGVGFAHRWIFNFGQDLQDSVDKK